MERRTESNKSWNPVGAGVEAQQERVQGGDAGVLVVGGGVKLDRIEEGIEWGMETPALEWVLKFWGFAGWQKDGNAPRDR